jgi:arylsulfatase A-like enzyme
MISRRQFVRTSAAASVAMMGLPGCMTQVAPTAPDVPSKQKLNILFILTDQWRASAFGYAGDPNVRTPHCDRLEAQSVHFRNCVSVHPICTPARASLLTGQFPTTNGVFHNDVPLNTNAVCMGDAFKAAGYDTGWIGKWHVDGHGRKAYIPPERRRGFDYWKTAECDHNYNHSHYYAGTDPTIRYWDGYDAYAQTADVKQYLRDRGGKGPFMFVVSYGPPHFPHETAPPEYKKLYDPAKVHLPPNVPIEMQDKARHEIVGYYGHCSAIDQCIGELMATLDETGLAKNTVVVLTSDHGEMMGSHGVAPLMKKFPYDESVRVPMLLRIPGQRHRVVATPMNTPDILPTMLGLCGLSIPSTAEGDDLSAVACNTAPEHDRAALLMSVSHGKMNCPEYRGIRTSRYTYVRKLDGPWLLFDDQTDPYQMKNLVEDAKSATLRKELDTRLNAELSKVDDPFHPRQYYLDKWNYPADTTVKEG